MTQIREYSLLILFTLAALATVYLSYGARLHSLVTETFSTVKREIVINR